MILGWNLH